MTVVSDMNHVATIRASLYHLNKFELIKEHLVISDTGADSYLAGDGWLMLYDPNGPCVPCVNVVGYCQQSTRQNGLTMGPMCMKASIRGGQTKFIFGVQMIANIKSNHSLVTPYQLRELGFLVDDVSKRHLKGPGEYGTQCIKLLMATSSI